MFWGNLFTFSLSLAQQHLNSLVWHTWFLKGLALLPFTVTIFFFLFCILYIRNPKGTCVASAVFMCYLLHGIHSAGTTSRFAEYTGELLDCMYLTLCRIVVEFLFGWVVGWLVFALLCLFCFCSSISKILLTLLSLLFLHPEYLYCCT